MTRDDIIRMAEEAEINLLFKGHPEHPERDRNDEIIFTGWVNHRTIRRFAALVAAEEREACAKICDDWLHANGNDCAAAIRARGET